jgi:iron(III) transport system ATP-binding protein
VQRPTRAARACLRAGNLAIVGAGTAGIGARVVRAVYQGGHFRIEAQLDHADGVLVHLIAADPCRLAPGDAIRLAIDDGWVLPATGESVPVAATPSGARRRADDDAASTSADS